MEIEQMKVRKYKTGQIVNWDGKKLIKAINESCLRARGVYLEPDEEEMIEIIIIDRVLELGVDVIDTNRLHGIVERALLTNKAFEDIGLCYFTYHSYAKNRSRSYEKIMQTINEAGSMGDLSNANADSTLASTLASISSDAIEEDRFVNFFLTNEERVAAEDGYIYFHDKGKRMNYSFNCCLFLLFNVMSNGCEMNGIWYNKPKRLDSAFAVASDLILSCASQQYGGFTVPRIDEGFAEYCEMEAEILTKELRELGVEESKIGGFVDNKINKALHQGFQGLEYKLNTVASSRGDYPFTTFTLGLGTSKYAKMAAKAALEVRAEGQGKPGHKKPVLFPKLVFLYDEALHGEGGVNRDVYDAGISCSMKACYPDWLSLTGDGYVASMYKKYKKVISPMGCRAFLSPWYERGGMEPADDNDVPVFEGRFNLGAVSLNLPMILAKAQKENRDFYEVLDVYLEMIRRFHQRVFEYIGNMPASRNPVAFCYGGLYGGNLKPTDKLAPVLKSATASFGITALNELNRLYNGKSIYEDGQFPLEVMEHINKRLAEYKKADGILYAVYGTPAESLCGKQVQQFRKIYGVVTNVSDREYVSNSFHCHVSEDISPIQKQDSEKRFWDYFNGGKIQYCRYKLGYNRKAVETLIDRAMDMGFYEGVNISLNYCDDCGYEAADLGDVCPKCGGIHITTIDRMNGYLGYTRVGKYTEEVEMDGGLKKIVYKGRFNKGKDAEIHDRVSM